MRKESSERSTRARRHESRLIEFQFYAQVSIGSMCLSKRGRETVAVATIGCVSSHVTHRKLFSKDPLPGEHEPLLAGAFWIIEKADCEGSTCALKSWREAMNRNMQRHFRVRFDEFGDSIPMRLVMAREERVPFAARQGAGRV